MFGPYGDKGRDGSGVATGTAASREHGSFQFSYYIPKDEAELARLLKEQPAYILRLVRDSLETAARGKAWTAAREEDRVTVIKPSGRREKVSREVAQMIENLKTELAQAKGKAK